MVLKFVVVKTPNYVTNCNCNSLNDIGFKKKKDTSTVKVRGETGRIPAGVDAKSRLSHVVWLVQTCEYIWQQQYM